MLRLDDLSTQIRCIRSRTEQLCASLEVEDYVVQSMPDVSPAKWHLAHTTWFFETFVLQRAAANYKPADARFGFLFNSYYNAAGERLPRPQRGMLTRPTVAEVYDYRRGVDESLERLFADGVDADHARLIEIGLHHEQQHQELLVTDIKHVLSVNPLKPAFRPEKLEPGNAGEPTVQWVRFDCTMRSIGHAGEGFCFDNERPQHETFVSAFEIADRPVTNREFLEFIADGGYRRPELWLSDGWDVVQNCNWTAPLYWEPGEAARSFTTHGMQPLDAHEPVTHVSFYEADAFARWKGARLPTEFEWETAALTVPVAGQFAESNRWHPLAADAASTGLRHMFGDVWEWTASPYLGYPGYRPPAGALGEYNGKFMCNQFVLRGGSCATPASHIRPTYRNFFYPDKRWQFSGIRLARDVA